MFFATSAIVVNYKYRFGTVQFLSKGGVAMSELRSAQWTVDAIENGTATAASIYKTASELDPVSLYFVFRYIRETYTPNNPAATGVMERMVELTRTYDDLVKRAKSGEKDSIREWFDDTYRMKDFSNKPHELMELIVDKIES
jgi:hypothetical protein